jgi:hypothetical protein
MSKKYVVYKECKNIKEYEDKLKNTLNDGDIIEYHAQHQLESKKYKVIEEGGEKKLKKISNFKHKISF